MVIAVTGVLLSGVTIVLARMCNAKLAQTCGALATTAKGAMTALPYKDDLQRSL